MVHSPRRRSLAHVRSAHPRHGIGPSQSGESTRVAPARTDLFTPQILTRADIDDLINQATVACPQRSSGARGDELYSLAEFLIERGDWTYFLEVRDALKRVGAADLAAQRAGPRLPAGVYSPYAFGAGVLTDQLRTRGPAGLSVHDLSSRATNRELDDLMKGRRWAELDPLISDRSVRRRLVLEFVARGEDLAHVEIPREDGDPPLTLQSWEPQAYSSGPSRGLETIWEEHPYLPESSGLPGSDAVLDQLNVFVDGWSQQRAARVNGTVLHAIAALGYTEAFTAQLALPDALALITRSIATGNGARGHGSLLLWSGRRFAWRLLRTLATMQGESTEPTRLAEAGHRVCWFIFGGDDEDDDGGCSAERCLAIEDPVTGIAWAVTAADSYD